MKSLCKSLVLSWKKLMPAAANGDANSKQASSGENNKENEKESGKAVNPVDVRDYCRKKLLSAIVTSETSAENLKTAEKFAASLEEEIFTMYKEPNSKYRNQVSNISQRYY